MVQRIPPDYYGILGVKVTATRAEVKAVYRKVAREKHPDVIGGTGPVYDEATRHFQLINEAYEVLSDTEKRAAYDKKRLTRQQSKSAASRATSVDTAASRKSDNKQNENEEPLGILCLEVVVYFITVALLVIRFMEGEAETQVVIWIIKLIAWTIISIVLSFIIVALEVVLIKKMYQLGIRIKSLVSDRWPSK